MKLRTVLAHLLALMPLLGGAAQALTIHDLKGQGLQRLYGTYAPHGDCKRAPRVVVDDSGFAFIVGGKTTRSGTIEWAVSYGPPDYQGISRWFFPFPLNDSDFGRVLMTFNPDERLGMLAFEPNLGPGEAMTALQAALVRGSPYAKCGQPAATATRGTPAATTTEAA